MSGSHHPVVLRFEGGDTIEILCAEDEDVISAAMRQNVSLNSHCRQGACGACRALAVDGDFEMPGWFGGHALSDAEVDEGAVLACQTHPRGALTLEFDYGVDRVECFL